MFANARRVLHVLAAVALYYSGILWLVRYGRRLLLHESATYVLGFHRILAESERHRTDSVPGMILGKSVFVELLDYLKQSVEFLTLEAFLQNDNSVCDREKPRCLVTFDDAWIDTGAGAAPLLKERGTPSVVFVPTGLVGNQEGFWVEQLIGAWKDPSSRDRFALLTDRVSVGNHRGDGIEEIIQCLLHMPAQNRQSILEGILPAGSSDGKGNVDSMMTWEQLAQIKDQGIEIGGHTVTHPLLTYEDDVTVERELRSSKRLLEQQLGASVRAFAYPNGDWDQRVRERVIEAGYACAFTTEARCCGQKDDKFAIPRFLLHDGNVSGLRGKFSRAMLNMTLAGWG